MHPLYTWALGSGANGPLGVRPRQFIDFNHYISKIGVFSPYFALLDIKMVRIGIRWLSKLIGGICFRCISSFAQNAQLSLLLDKFLASIAILHLSSRPGPFGSGHGHFLYGRFIPKNGDIGAQKATF
jgi:hypothetical protein